MFIDSIKLGENRTIKKIKINKNNIRIKKIYRNCIVE